MCTEDVRKLKKRTGFFMIYFDLVHFNKKATFICKQIKLRIKMVKNRNTNGFWLVCAIRNGVSQFDCANIYIAEKI